MTNLMAQENLAALGEVVESLEEEANSTVADRGLAAWQNFIADVRDTLSTINGFVGMTDGDDREGFRDLANRLNALLSR